MELDLKGMGQKQDVVRGIAKTEKAVAVVVRDNATDKGRDFVSVANRSKIRLMIRTQI
jgi:hypothetical protein